MNGHIESLQKRYPGTSRFCLYVLTKHINAPKLCMLNYECFHCAFDQWLDDFEKEEAKRKTVYFKDTVSAAA